MSSPSTSLGKAVAPGGIPSYRGFSDSFLSRVFGSECDRRLRPMSLSKVRPALSLGPQRPRRIHRPGLAAHTIGICIAIATSESGGPTCTWHPHQGTWEATPIHAIEEAAALDDRLSGRSSSGCTAPAPTERSTVPGEGSLIQLTVLIVERRATSTPRHSSNRTGSRRVWPEHKSNRSSQL